MSYYVTITRKSSPNETGGEKITESEWRSLALSDGDMRPPTDAEIATSAPFGRTNDLIWTGHSQYPTVWFSWSEGKIDVKNPDQLILKKMATLASGLRAKLIGEGGEFYDHAGNSKGVQKAPDKSEIQKIIAMRERMQRERRGE